MLADAPSPIQSLGSMVSRSRRPLSPAFIAPMLALTLAVAGCGGPQPNTRDVLVISVGDQKLALYQDQALVRVYPVSTSRFGVGNTADSNRTPLGWMEVAMRVGDGAPTGAVFRSREWTGEVVGPRGGDEDLVLTRLLWLRGSEPHNRNTFRRYIYIHGTNQEHRMDSPSSQGCVRMTSRDILDLFDRVDVGARVHITARSL